MTEQAVIENVVSLTDAVDYPEAIRALVTSFLADLDRYRGAEFKEMALRSDFLNPLLEALGWDPINKSGRPYSEREVIQEDSVTIGGSAKAPDYAMVVDGKRRFFVEAKRPSVSIADSRETAFQIRRYCWSANLPFGLVTDFEEFAIYDCRAIPDKDDSPHVGRIAYFAVNDLEENWRLLHGMFGRDNVADGILELLASESKPPRGTRAVDMAFLTEIRAWRQGLAADVAGRNARLGTLEVNTAVQTLIDRLVFLRVSEARGLEAEGGLAIAASDQPGVYARLLELFKRADDRYNSGLFHLHELSPADNGVDVVGLSVEIGDDLLRTIVGRLYYPEPYEFSVVGADILGRIYEQFLGERIHVAADRTVEIALKPEFRKSGGVYYTPTPVVDYIVEETLAPLLKGKTPNEVSRIAIVDPASGSGSFLIAAYQYVLDWHRDYYATRPRLASQFLEPGPGGQLRLKTPERKRILLNNIYGVDIDPQAVEVSRLSLLLKVTEGQTQLEFDIGHILPDLDANIVCGNSLIGLDFQMPLELSPEDKLNYNPFDWHAGFPTVFSRGGFDAVIGNPPYLNVDVTWGKSDPRLAYIKAAYSTVYTDKTDLLFYFLRKAADICRGEMSFIVSRSFLEADKAQKLRGWLAANTRIRAVLDFRHAAVFPDVGINTAVIRYTKSTAVKTTRFARYEESRLPPGYTASTLREAAAGALVSVSSDRLSSTAWNFGVDAVEKVLGKIDAAGTPVGEILHVGKGMETGKNEAFVMPFDPDRLSALVEQGLLYTRARNSDIHVYEIRNTGPAMLYPENAASFESLPEDVRGHLLSQRPALEERAAFKRGNCLWWKYTWPLHKEHFGKARIFCPYRSSTNRFALDDSSKYLGITDTTVLYGADQPEDLRYILAVLNSRVLTARFRFIGKLLGGGVLEYYENTVRRLPIPRSRPGAREHDEVVRLAHLVEAAKQTRATTLLADERSQLDTEISGALDRIEEIVQSLFGLSAAEIELLEAQLT